MAECGAWRKYRLSVYVFIKSRTAYPTESHLDLRNYFASAPTRIFAKRYGHRAVVLETVAAVSGMVGATFTHLKCLRRTETDKGWIRALMVEVENEWMHVRVCI